MKITFLNETFALKPENNVIMKRKTVRNICVCKFLSTTLKSHILKTTIIFKPENSVIMKSKTVRSIGLCKFLLQLA